MGAQRPAAEVETIVTPTTMPIWTTADPRPAPAACAAGKKIQRGAKGRERENRHREGLKEEREQTYIRIKGSETDIEREQTQERNQGTREKA